MPIISQKTVDRSLNNNRVIGRLMTLYDRHYETIRRWIEKREECLTTPGPMKIFREEIGLSDSELLEHETEGAVK